jgi:hypothetical protein
MASLAVLRRQSCLSPGPARHYHPSKIRCAAAQAVRAQRTPTQASPATPKPFKIPAMPWTGTKRPFPDPRVNPPTYCRPADFAQPVRASAEAPHTWYWRLAKTYISFYKTGFKSYWAASKQAKVIRRLARDAAKSPQQQSPSTRADLQILHRTAHAEKRIPVVAIMFLVTFEFFPLIMYLLGKRAIPLLPYVLRLPYQVELDRDVRLRRWVNIETKWRNVNPNELDLLDFVRYSAEFHGLGGRLWPLKWTPNIILRTRVKRHYDYLRCDDLQLWYDGVQGLEDDEVVIAALQRGLWDRETPMLKLRQRLQRSVKWTIDYHLEDAQSGRKEREEQEDKDNGRPLNHYK